MMVICPSPSIASRALTAMFTSAVSNWLGSALMKTRSSGRSVTSLIRAPVSVPTISVIARTPSQAAKHLGLEGLAAGEGEELARQAGGPVHRVRDRADVAHATFLRQVRSFQEVGGRLITVSRLLKSWATPPVSCPTASNFCAWRSASSARSRAFACSLPAVMSRAEQ